MFGLCRSYLSCCKNTLFTQSHHTIYQIKTKMEEMTSNTCTAKIKICYIIKWFNRIRHIWPKFIRSLPKLLHVTFYVFLFESLHLHFFVLYYSKCESKGVFSNKIYKNHCFNLYIGNVWIRVFSFQIFLLSKGFAFFCIHIFFFTYYLYHFKDIYNTAISNAYLMLHIYEIIYQ